MGSPGDVGMDSGAPSGGAPFATAPMLLGLGMLPFIIPPALLAFANVPGAFAAFALAINAFVSVSPQLGNIMYACCIWRALYQILSCWQL